MLIVPVSFNSNSSFKFLKEKSILKQVIKEFLSIYYNNRQHKKKWPVVSVSEPQSHIGSEHLQNYDKVYFHDSVLAWAQNFSTIQQILILQKKGC